MSSVFVHIDLQHSCHQFTGTMIETQDKKDAARLEIHVRMVSNSFPAIWSALKTRPIAKMLQPLLNHLEALTFHYPSKTHSSR